jgi:hypothetical protein
MAYINREQAVERMEVKQQFRLARRYGTMLKIAERTKSDRIRKKATRFTKGVMAVANKAAADLEQFDLDMTDREIRDLIWIQQQACLRHVRQCRLRIQGMVGSLGHARFVGPDRVIRILNQQRNELKAHQ